MQADTSSGASAEAQTAIDPYYQELKIGSAETAQFVLTRPFVFSSGDGTGRNLTSVMIARNDPDNYGKLEEIVMVASADGKTERNNSVDGPVQANRKMVTYGPVTEYQTLTGQIGSTMRYGNILILPQGDSLVYMRPIYVAQEESTRFTVKKVVMVSGDSVGFGDSVEQALADLVDSKPDGAAVIPSVTVPSTNSDPGSSTTTVPSGEELSATELIAQADQKFTEADERLKASDLAGYAALVAEARVLISQASAKLVAEGATAKP